MSRALEIVVQLEKYDRIRISPPRTITGVLGDPLEVPFVVRVGDVALHADRDQLVRLRDALTAALDEQAVR